jgi:hypothetical protein
MKKVYYLTKDKDITPFASLKALLESIELDIDSLPNKKEVTYSIRVKEVPDVIFNNLFSN